MKQQGWARSCCLPHNTGQAPPAPRMSLGMAGSRQASSPHCQPQPRHPAWENGTRRGWEQHCREAPCAPAPCLGAHSVPRISGFSKKLLKQLFPLSGRVHVGENNGPILPQHLIAHADWSRTLHRSWQPGSERPSTRGLSLWSPHCSPTAGMCWLPVPFKQQPLLLQLSKKA